LENANLDLNAADGNSVDQIGNNGAVFNPNTSVENQEIEPNASNNAVSDDNFLYIAICRPFSNTTTQKKNPYKILVIYMDFFST
jgi:hypothetical protein